MKLPKWLLLCIAASIAMNVVLVFWLWVRWPAVSRDRYLAAIARGDLAESNEMTANGEWFRVSDVSPYMKLRRSAEPGHVFLRVTSDPDLMRYYVQPEPRTWKDYLSGRCRITTVGRTPDGESTRIEFYFGKAWLLRYDGEPYERVPEPITH